METVYKLKQYKPIRKTPIIKAIGGKIFIALNAVNNARKYCQSWLLILKQNRYKNIRLGLRYYILRLGVIKNNLDFLKFSKSITSF